MDDVIRAANTELRLRAPDGSVDIEQSFHDLMYKLTDEMVRGSILLPIVFQLSKGSTLVHVLGQGLCQR